ncbi:protein of unknown function [Sarcina sp. DSM 11001]|uniref:DUF937 domain-containing protein n=1 Tax=Sarcina sp. DSM 11001 TaxID=1798184 RepID=UPI00088E7600|nr:DUF937 domain-containing protein [Sarcina sp. DSM 11001]SDL66286.1 protein of unknown function [Sarcina sp. DSM 11001]
MNLLQLLLGAMTTQSSVGSVSGKTGLSNKQIQKLMMLAIPLLLKYMTGNATSSGSGALSLLGALSQHTNKKDMAQQLNDADEDDGEKIIGHILGNNEKKVEHDLAAQTGLNEAQIKQVLSIMAPALMSGVSEAATASAASGKPAAAAAPASPLEALAGSGIFGALFGGGKKNDSANQKENDGAADGTALLQALLKAGNKK